MLVSTVVRYHVQTGIITLVSHSHRQNERPSPFPGIPLETAEPLQGLHLSQIESKETIREERCARHTNAVTNAQHTNAKYSQTKVSAVLLGLGRLHLQHLIMLRKVKFYWHLYCSTDVFLRDMFLNFLLCYVKYDCILKSVFYSRSDAVSNVYVSSDNYVIA